MSKWYRAVQKDLGNIVKAIEYFEIELKQGRIEISLAGNIEKNSRDIPGIVEHRFSQLQEIEAILEHLNIELRKLRSIKYKQFLEHYQRQLTSRDVQQKPTTTTPPGSISCLQATHRQHPAGIGRQLL